MNIRTLASVAALALLITACKKDKPLPPTPPAPAPTGDATIRMQFNWVSGMNAFDMNATYADGAGNPVRFTTLKFYASDFHLTDDDDVTVAEYHHKVVLVDAAATDNIFTLGTMAPGHVHEVHFALGLDSETNHADPTVAEYPLNIPGMHWSWNPAAGYKFLNMEGYIDSNGNGVYDSGTEQAFTYHCATDALRRELHRHIHADANAGSTVVLGVKVDVNTLLAGLDLLANHTAMGGSANNQTTMNNLVAAISPM